MNKKKGRKIALFLLLILGLFSVILGSYTKLHASDFKEYIIPVNLGDASGKPFQITFENAEIVDFYTLQDDGSLRSVFLLNWYNNIIQYENSTNSGVVIDETLYVKVKTSNEVNSSDEVHYKVFEGTSSQPFDFTNVNLSKGNVLKINGLRTDNKSIVSKVYLQEGRKYVIKGQTYRIRVLDDQDNILYDKGDYNHTRSLLHTFKVERSGYYFLESLPTSSGNNIGRIEFAEVGVKEINLKVSGLYESFSKSFFIDSYQTIALTNQIDHTVDYDSYSYLLSDKEPREYTVYSDNIGDYDILRGFNTSVYKTGININTFYTSNKSLLIEFPYNSSGSMFSIHPNNKLTITNNLKYLPRIGSQSKEEIQELKVDDRESSEIGDPVDAFRGNFVDRKTLLSYSGDNALSFDMSYDSIANDSFSLASGFTHNFETKLVKTGDEIALYWNPNAISRLKKEDGVWKSTREKDEYQIEETENGFTVNERENQYQFDLDGRLVRQQNAVGHYVDYLYSDTGKLKEVRNHRNQSFHFEYAGDKLSKVSDEAGRAVSFVYDSTNTQLNKIVYPNAKELVFTYQADTQTEDSPAKLKKMTFDGKTLVDNTYNLVGAVDYQYDGNGNKTTFVYDEWTDADTITTIMKQADGTTIEKTHNQIGQVIREKNERGFVRTFKYDLKGDKIEETDFKGNVIFYEYDEDGNLAKTLYPDESTVQYEYNDVGFITKMIDKDGLSIVYSYNEKNQMISMTDKKGQITEFEYDSMGNVVKQTINERVLEREYDAKGNLVRIMLPDGKYSIHEYDVLGRQTATTVNDETRIETVYDNQNNVLKQVNPDGTFVSYEYDAFGKKIKETDSMGRVTTFTYDTNGNLRTESKGLRGVNYSYDKMNRLISKSYKNVSGTYTYTYDGSGNIIQEKDESGVLTTRTFDENNQLLTEKVGNDTTTFTYDVMGRVVEKVDPLGNSYKYEYNPLGLLIKTISPLGYETRYNYDEMGRQIELVDPKGNIYQTIYNENGEKVEEINPLGESVRYEYDTNGRLISTTNALNQKNNLVYNSLGQIVEQRNARNEVVAQMKYDALGRVIEMTDGNGNMNRMVYDAVGNLIESYNAEGNLIAKNEFNEFDELVKTVNALNSVTSYEYNLRGLQTKMIDSLGYETIYSYNSNGQLYSTKDANLTIAYNYYDSKGRLIQNKISSFANKYAYNANDQIVLETMPGGNTLAFQYDPENKLIERKNGRGDLSNYEYDKNGNLVKETTKEGTVLHDYDKLNRRIRTESASGLIERKYDALGRVIEKTQNGKTISYQYDDRGHLVSMMYPDGKEVSYSYDVMGNLLTVTDWKDNVTSYAYNKNNQLVKTTHSNGVIEEREYNVAGQLISLKSYKDELLVTHFTYEYDLNGNITKEVDVKTGKENVYTYDKLGRLTNANGNSYTYTPTGNISNYQITHNGQAINRTLTYNYDNQLSKIGSDLTSIDKDGNLLTYKLNGKTYVATYDSQNKLVQYGNMYFQYDSEGNRIGIRETDGLGVTTKDTSFVVDNDSNRLSRILVETSANGDIYYVYGHGLISEHKGDDVNTYHFDYRGSTVAMTNQNGDVIGEAEYDEYGVILKSTIVTRYMYNGQFGIENDGNGLYYMRTRYYNVDLKKFMNRDVVVGNIQESQTLNRYAYVNGNPVNFTDPFGMARETVENTQAQAQGIGGVNMNTIHFVLDMIGMVPVLGEFADAANVVLYMAEGNYKMAALSAAAMVPIIGNFMTGGKMVSKVVGKLDTAKDAVVKGATNAWGWVKKQANRAINARIPIGRSYEIAGVGRIQNDTSLKEAYQFFAGKAKTSVDKKAGFVNPHPIQNINKYNKGINKKGKVTDKRYARAGFRKGVKEQVWDMNKDSNGKVYDPLTGVELKFNEPWDMGHKPGYEHWKHQRSALARDISRKQFIDEYNDVNKYRPELPSSNRSHADEGDNHIYKGS